MSWLPLGPADGRTAWTVRSPDGRTFAVFAVDGGVRVTDAACPHAAARLVDGRIRDGRLHCPWHWFRFDLDTGACLTASRYRLGVYPVQHQEDGWFADVGTPRRRRWGRR